MTPFKKGDVVRFQDWGQNEVVLAVRTYLIVQFPDGTVMEDDADNFTKVGEIVDLDSN